MPKIKREPKKKEKKGKKTSEVKEATAAESPIVINVCPECKGKKFLEYQAGTVMVQCPKCKGSGEYGNNDSAE